MKYYHKLAIMKYENIGILCQILNGKLLCYRASLAGNVAAQHAVPHGFDPMQTAKINTVKAST
jgi:hypothetical protein